MRITNAQTTHIQMQKPEKHTHTHQLSPLNAHRCPTKHIVRALFNNHEEFERHCLNSVWEKANVKIFPNSRNMSIISYEQVRKLRIVVYEYSRSSWRKKQPYNVWIWSYRNINSLVKTVWDCCDLEIPSRSLEAVWMGEAQRVLPSWKARYLSYSVRENWNIRVFATYGHSASRPA